MTRKRVAILISGRGSNMAALIAVAKDKDYPAEIALVVSNRPDAGGLQYARDNAIETAIVDHKIYGKDRAAFERAIHGVLQAHRIEIVCLAGFMRVLTPLLVGLWDGRMMNIHPSLLPAFKGLHTHERALAAGVKEHGASVHFVVADMDAGPVITRGAVEIRAGDNAEELAGRVLAVEHRLYPLALRLVAQGRVRVEDGRCVVEGALSAEEARFIPGMHAR